MTRIRYVVRVHFVFDLLFNVHDECIDDYTIKCQQSAFVKNNTCTIIVFFLLFFLWIIIYYNHDADE